MKKIFLAIMAVATITFSACDGTAKGGSETDSIAAVATEKANEAIEEAEEQVKEAVEDAEEKAKEAANEVVDKAAEDAKNAIKDKLGL